MANDIKALKGLVATVVTTGDVKPQYALAWSNMRDYNSRNGFVNVEYRSFDAKLVEAGRDEVCEHALAQKYSYLLMIDADAARWPEASMERMLNTIFVKQPHIDVVGGYAQLRQPPFRPTIDTGTGTWELIYPNAGLLPVIRTGGHFLMIKTSLLQRMEKPWFRTRVPYTPIKAFAELDNFARCTLDGRNPLMEHPEWETLFMQAKKASAGKGYSRVGEDSGFCDAAKAVGGQLAVDTDIVVGHVTDRVIMPTDLIDAMDKDKASIFARLGLLNYD